MLFLHNPNGDGTRVEALPFPPGVLISLVFHLSSW